MRKRTMIEALSMGDTCELDLLLLKMVQRTAKTTGNPFVEMILTDGSSIITARRFNTMIEDLEMEGVMPEMVVRVVIAVDTYYGKPNYIVCDIWRENNPPEYVREFIPKADIDIDQAFSKLVALIRLNSGAYTDLYAPVGRLAEQVLLDNMSSFCHSAGGASKHHSRIGGLLEHSLGVATEASRVAEYHKGLDAELLVSGAALHDIGKIQELYTSPCGNITYTEKQLVGGHALIGMNMIDASLEKSNLRFDPHRVIQLKHIIGSHHGHPGARGSLPPTTAEAKMVQLLDEMDAMLDAAA